MRTAEEAVPQNGYPSVDYILCLFDSVFVKLHTILQN